jgi:O-succinylhomoserine sulfhydrylase
MTDPTRRPEGELALDTLAVRSALPRTPYGEHSEALFLTSSFVHPDAATAAARFAGEQDGFVYSRFSNPTVASFEQRLAALEGTEGCMATGSGMAAILLLAMATLRAGDHVVCSRGVFGSIVNLFGRELARFGVETTFVSQTDVAEWKAALRPATRMLFAETPSNPLTEVCDIAALADLAHSAGAELVVDNSFCSPALQRPTRLGADWVIHSGTKYLDGQGRVIAGAVCGSAAAIHDRLLPMQRTVGMSLSPFNAWIVLKGMETLSVRMAAHSERALTMARWLEQHPAVARVFHPGLESHPQHALAMRQQQAGGAVLSFELRADDADQARARAFHVIDQTRICSITANLGDTKTTITHPSTTTHGRLREDQRQAAGIGQGLIRLAVGLEDVGDLQSDLARSLDTVHRIHHATGG